MLNHTCKINIKSYTSRSHFNSDIICFTVHHCALFQLTSSLCVCMRVRACIRQCAYVHLHACVRVCLAYHIINVAILCLPTVQSNYNLTLSHFITCIYMRLHGKSCRVSCHVTACPTSTSNIVMHVHA